MNVLKYVGRGIYHSDREVECQDSLDSLITEQGRVILVLSDGCGSCLHAKIASDTVVNTVLEYYSDIETTLSNDVAAKKQILELINERLFQKACELSYKDTYEFSATMVFAIVEKNYVLVGHIGDGALICYGENGEIFFESAAENGANKYETYFVNSHDALSHFRLDLLDLEEKSILRNLVMYSDGPEKMFDNHIEKGLNNGAASLVENVRNNNITDCEQLGEYLHGIFSDSLSNAGDDWSLIVYDRDQSMCMDFDPEPVEMASVFYDRYSKKDAVSDFFIRQKQSVLDWTTEPEGKDDNTAWDGPEESIGAPNENAPQNTSGIVAEVEKKKTGTENDYNQAESEQISFIEKNIEEIYADSEALAYNFSEIKDTDYMLFETEFVEYSEDLQEVEHAAELADEEKNTLADEVKQDKKQIGKLKSYLRKVLNLD